MILEIRTYRLRPGTRDDFVRVMRDGTLPLLEEFGIQVVDCGTSLVAEDGHDEAYLIRAFPSLEVHRRQEDAFYASDAWLDGPREALLELIESYHTIVLETSEAVVAGLRDSGLGRGTEIDPGQGRSDRGATRAPGSSTTTSRKPTSPTDTAAP
jgi:hypothetical protein